MDRLSPLLRKIENQVERWGYVALVAERLGVPPDVLKQEIDPRQTMAKDAAILGMSLWNTPPEELTAIHAALGAGLSCGALHPIVGREMPLTEAPRAHEAVMEPGALGKIVLVV